MLKLIKALDLQHWADTKESEALMPELMRRLIHASLKEITYVSFPNEDNVYMPGFDGVLEVNQSNPYVSTGLSVFEIGTNRNQKKKADGDYDKRTKETASKERKVANFVFVTPRIWTASSRWLATFSGRLLLSIHTMPCMGEDDAIDEERLREYIATLQKLGEEKKKMSMVNHTIGQLLANCPQCIQGCPPGIICEIIEGLNNKSVNDSFHAQIYNRLGSTVRGPYDGGDIEYNKAARFRKTAEELQIMYPITSEIFRDLSDVYLNEAKRHDTEVEIMKLDN